MVAPSVYQQWVAVGVIWGFYGLFFLLSRGWLVLRPRRVLMMLGGLTYPLYLIHNVASKVLMDHFDNAALEAFMVPLVVIFMVVTAWLIHHFIENRCISVLKQRLLESKGKA